MGRLFAGLLAVVLSVFILSAEAPAQSVASIRQQLQTAIFHSGELAQRGTAVAATRTHLQHTINCLVGPAGPGFNPAPGNPCQGQGNGAIPDLEAAARADVRGAARALIFARTALFLAQQALQSNDVNEAQPFAIVISRQLQQALAAL